MCSLKNCQSSKGIIHIRSLKDSLVQSLLTSSFPDRSALLTFEFLKPKDHVRQVSAALCSSPFFFGYHLM